MDMFVRFGRYLLSFIVIVVVRIFVFFLTLLVSLMMFYGGYNTPKDKLATTKIENENIENQIIELSSTLTEQENIFNSDEYISYDKRIKAEALAAAEKAAAEKAVAEKAAAEKAAAEKAAAEKAAAEKAAAEKAAAEKAAAEKAAAEKAAAEKAAAEAKAKAKQEGVRIGMTQQEVLDSSWGKPLEINRDITADEIDEQWVYSNYNYLYFEDGILTEIQN